MAPENGELTLTFSKAFPKSPTALESITPEV
jgi:hypothetical protein